MAETLQIEVKFNPENYESPFGLPRRIEVQQGTTIEWIIKEPHIFEDIFFSKRRFTRGMKFTIYFEGSSAFEWKSESLLVSSYPPFFPQPYPILVASGKAENKGDHKYGLKLVAADRASNSEPDYDDDPFLRVY
ncbi:hypothetical protein [Roseivirga thermotolerans]|uniref:hypothetical protein n=1 Tax=Roseivirga thermotolerans TaxID=1758176 RepID=UPI00273F2402|nr:hypothetical protein [Roseivirga thermotolerans]